MSSSSTSTDDRLSSIPALPSASKTAAYTSLLDDVLKSNDQDTLSSFLNSFVDAVTATETVSLVVSKQVVAVLVARLKEDVKDVEVKRVIGEKTLELCSLRQASFEEQIVSLREMLADLLEQAEDWTDAAKMLQGIPLDSTNRSVPDEYRLKNYVRIVRLLLEDGDTVSAQSYLSRAQNLIRNTNDQETILAFKLSQARIYDAQRKFPEASSKYHEISYVSEIDEGERLQMLSASVTCAILSPAGPRRSRLLATLYRDERSSQLPHYTILSAMFLDRIIRAKEVKEFSEMLEEHQRAKLGSGGMGVIIAGQEDELDDGMMEEDGSKEEEKVKRKRGPEDVLDKAIMEHNLLSASHIYSQITFSGLGLLLNLLPSSAEAMARTMIIQGRLKGASIDQVDRLITFSRTEKDESTESGSSNVAAAAALDVTGGGNEVEEELPISTLAPETARWDMGIRRMAQLTEELAVRCGSLMSTSAAITA